MFPINPVTSPVGIRTNPPPESHIPSIQNAITSAFKSLPPGTKGGLFGMVNESGANAVIATKGPGGIQIEAYIGKEWKGSLDYGVNVMKTW